MESEVVFNKGGSVTFSGDATLLYRAKMIKSALRMSKTGLIMTRGATKSKLMQMVTEQYSHKKYKRGEVDLAIADMEKWILACEAAMPVRIE